jgi:hypothetical protein
MKIQNNSQKLLRNRQTVVRSGEEQLVIVFPKKEIKTRICGHLFSRLKRFSPNKETPDCLSNYMKESEKEPTE